MKVNFEKIKLSSILKIALFLGVVAIAASILISNFKSSYKEMVYDWRKQKDRYFKTDSTTPLENTESFNGLSYFEPNPEFKVVAHLTLLHDSIPTFINRTDGKKEKYVRYAIASFTLKKKEYTLTLFKSLKSKTGEKVLFLPFTDKSSGELTYGGGRYLDLELQEPEKITIDFNYAYNPYCAYNPRFSCPIPPKENYLDMDVTSGEKIFEKKKTDNTDSIRID